MLVFLAACANWFGGGDTAGDSDDSGLAEDSGEVDTGELAADDARVRALTELPGGDSQCQAPMLVRVTYITDGDTVNVEPEVHMAV